MSADHGIRARGSLHIKGGLVHNRSSEVSSEGITGQEVTSIGSGATISPTLPNAENLGPGSLYQRNDNAPPNSQGSSSLSEISTTLDETPQNQDGSGRVESTQIVDSFGRLK